MDEDAPVIVLEALETLKEQRDTIKRLKDKLFASPDSFVHCKDCKHKEESVSPSWEAWCNRFHFGCDLDWFCADGERKEKTGVLYHHLCPNCIYDWWSEAAFEDTCPNCDGKLC